MIDFVTIKPLVASQIAALTGLDPKLVRWVDEPSGTLAGALPVIWLCIDPLGSIGIDYEQRTDNGTDEQIVTVVGQRQFTLKIRIESFTPDIADTRHAANLGEALRTRLFRSTAKQSRAGVFAVSQVLMTKKLEYVEANRPINAYLMDLLCLAASNDVDDTPGTGDWIGEVQGSGTIKNDDGNIVDAPTFDVSYTKPPLH